MSDYEDDYTINEVSTAAHVFVDPTDVNILITCRVDDPGLAEAIENAVTAARDAAVASLTADLPLVTPAPNGWPISFQGAKTA